MPLIPFSLLSVRKDQESKAHLLYDTPTPALGHLMAPPGVARFIASLFPQASTPNCRLLVAGAGMGALSAAFLVRCVADELDFTTFSLDAYESDEALLDGRREILAGYAVRFPTRALMARTVSDIAWETEVWVADAPSHLIHFNGSRFLGPYQ